MSKQKAPRKGGAPLKNTNARKGKHNRQMWAQRLPVDVIEIIKARSTELEISQADYVAGLVRQYNKSFVPSSEAAQPAQD